MFLQNQIYFEYEIVNKSFLKENNRNDIEIVLYD